MGLKDCGKCMGDGWVWSDVRVQEVPCCACQSSGIDPASEPDLNVVAGANWMFATGHRDAINLADDDRRFMVPTTHFEEPET